MLTYSDVKTFLSNGLATDYPGLLIDAGPNTDTKMQKKSPQRMVFASVSGGSGLTTEHLYERAFINVRTIGNQRDYTDAEKLALAVDKLLCAVDSNAKIGNTGVLYIVRVGGRPQLVDRDSADRYHFQCTYVTEAQTGF